MSVPASDFVMPSLALTTRVALVTGGSRGLGLGIALALAHAGADVAVVSRTHADVQAAADRLRGLDRKSLGIAADVTDPGVPSLLVERTIAHFGRLDILVHAAGVNMRAPAEQFTREDYARIMRTNVESAFFLSQAAAPAMRAQGHGRIIAVSSIAAELAIPRIALYAMSKGALRQMVRVLAIEWAKDGITVNALAPGRFWTAMTDDVFSDPELHASAVRVIPMGRPGVASDLAGAAVLLASDASAYITGQSLVVDGGWMVSGGVQG